MTRPSIVHVLALGAGLVWLLAAAYPGAAALSVYDRSAETTSKGVILQVVSFEGPDGAVGVHMNVKTDAGVVNVHVGPALFIGQSNFWFQIDDVVEVTGARMSNGADSVVWARSIVKGAKTLKLRDEDGTPLWKINPAAEPDGCGVVHVPVR